ncbi:universal stress protein [Pseudomaricurvus sp.]|uniref:universal stress protein n=1 Tax=Pseudomaricurvus sp. TaxID=2004510 RepID=UPI003F6D2F08
MEQQINVLVVIDPSQQTHPALERALLLAKRPASDTSAKMVFVVTPFKHTLQQTPAVLCTSEWLKENLHDQMAGSHVEYSVVLGWGSSSNDIIIEAGKELNVSLTIAPYYEEQSGGRFLSDERWKLLRESTNPVLIASRPAENHTGKILCTLKSQDPENSERDSRMLATTARFTETFGMEAHIVNSYDDSMEYPDRAKIAALANVPNERIHVKQGEPEDVICDTANDIDADIIVIASQQRKGLRGALRGNTIEKIIGRLDRDILMI